MLLPKTDGFSDDDTVVVVAVGDCTVIETVEAEDVTPKPVSVTEIVSAPEASVSVNDHAPVFASAVMVSLTPLISDKWTVEPAGGLVIVGATGFSVIVPVFVIKLRAEFIVPVPDIVPEFLMVPELVMVPPELMAPELVMVAELVIVPELVMIPPKLLLIF